MLRSRDAQLKAGKTEREVLVPNPDSMLAWTFEIQLYRELPVAIPVCLNHLSYKEESRLAL
jgi:hypothetical protein